MWKTEDKGGRLPAVVSIRTFSDFKIYPAVYSEFSIADADIKICHLGAWELPFKPKLIAGFLEKKNYLPGF